jgi:hypothetical protein
MRGKTHTSDAGLGLREFPINDCIRPAFGAGMQIAVIANSL